VADTKSNKSIKPMRSNAELVSVTQKKMNTLTSEGTTGVPTGAAGLGGTGGACGIFPATTAASKSESLALTTKRREGNDFVAA